MNRSPARAIALAGFMGAGKSTVGAAVADLLGLPLVDLDLAVERRHGRSVAELFAAEGEATFRGLEAEALCEELVAGAVVALGGGTVMDERSWRLLRERATTVWLDASAEVLWARVGASLERPLAADRGEFERRYAERMTRYAECDLRVDASGPPEQVAQEVARRCGG